MFRRMDVSPVQSLFTTRSLPVLGCLALLCCCGCPWTTRYPVFNAENNEAARRTSQLQDPFPDNNIGPDAEFRPREFGMQRSEQQLAKSRSYASWLRIQARPASVQPAPTGPTLPGFGYLPAPYPAFPGQVVSGTPGAMLGQRLPTPPVGAPLQPF